MTSFVLPGGSSLAAALHVARAATRRAERVLVAAEAGILPRGYINRLSDWLFTAARVAKVPGVLPVLELGYRAFLPVRPYLSRLAGRLSRPKA